MTLAVILHNETTLTVPDQAAFQQWVDCALEHATTEVDALADSVTDITICIIEPEHSAELNHTYRQKHGPTNVLSFDYDPIPNVPQTSLGDLAICAHVMQAEAAALGIELTAHWAHLTVHGVLHLLGYDHEVPDDAKRMEALEVTILHALNYPNPYQEANDHV